MIGPANPNMPACECCGSFQPEHEMVLYRFELICDACRQDHDAKEAEANADEFRWLSWNWLRTSHLERKPYMHNIQFPRRDS